MYSLGNMVFPRPFLEYTKNEICSFLPVLGITTQLDFRMQSVQHWNTLRLLLFVRTNVIWFGRRKYTGLWEVLAMLMKGWMEQQVITSIIIYLLILYAVSLIEKSAIISKLHSYWASNCTLIHPIRCRHAEITTNRNNFRLALRP